MKKISTEKWKEFELGYIISKKDNKKIGNGLFEIVNSKSYHSKNIKEIEESENSLNYITRSKFNNGLKYKIVNKNTYIINPKNTISFGAENADFFYQEKEYITGNKMYYIDTRNLSKFTCLFLKCTLQMTFTSNYSFSDGMIPLKIYNKKIKLPVNSKGKPDWKYMENYMKFIFKISEENINSLYKNNKNKNKIDIKKWKKFHLYDEKLFYIDMGTKLDKSKMKVENPTINFVGRANTNNGITTKIDKIDGITLYKSGNMTLSLGGEYLGSCFIQPEDFYTSQNVAVLTPKWNMSNEIKRFIGTMVFKESQTHYKAFVDELNKHIKTDFSFYLPITKNNEPDWKYM